MFDVKLMNDTITVLENSKEIGMLVTCQCSDIILLKLGDNKYEVIKDRSGKLIDR